MNTGDLFDTRDEDTIRLTDEGMDITYQRAFLKEDASNALFSELLSLTPWRQPELWMFGRKVKTPRLTAWYGDSGAGYVYSGIKNEPMPWTPALSILKAQIEKKLGASFNSVLLNLYRDGADHLSWHNDNEKELGLEPVIASVSLGAERIFSLRSPNTTVRNNKYDLLLENGSLLCMSGKTQLNWEHAIKKSAKITSPRINLTFRKVLSV